MRNQRRGHDHNKWAFYSNAKITLSIEILRKPRHIGLGARNLLIDKINVC